MSYEKAALDRFLIWRQEKRPPSVTSRAREAITNTSDDMVGDVG